MKTPPRTHHAHTPAPYRRFLREKASLISLTERSTVLRAPRLSTPRSRTQHSWGARPERVRDTRLTRTSYRLVCARRFCTRSRQTTATAPAARFAKVLKRRDERGRRQALQVFARRARYTLAALGSRVRDHAINAWRLRSCWDFSWRGGSCRGFMLASGELRGLSWQVGSSGDSCWRVGSSGDWVGKWGAQHPALAPRPGPPRRPPRRAKRPTGRAARTRGAPP